jgi:YHS domain-containing protein
MKKTIIILAVIGLAILVGCEKKTEPMTEPAAVTDEHAGHEHAVTETAKTAEAAVADATEQTTCPVMEGNPIDKSIFVEYQGKKVYFCCPACQDVFNKDPEKYISKLPQFKQ